MNVATDERTYSAREVVEIAGFTYRKLDYWIRTGVIEASVRGARGSGSSRRFSHNDLLVAQALAFVAEFDDRSCGVPLRSFRAAVPQLREVLASDPRPAGVFVTPAGEVSLEPVNGFYVDLTGLPPP